MLGIHHIHQASNHLKKQIQWKKSLPREQTAKCPLFFLQAAWWTWDQKLRIKFKTKQDVELYMRGLKFHQKIFSIHLNLVVPSHTFCTTPVWAVCLPLTHNQLKPRQCGCARTSHLKQCQGAASLATNPPLRYFVQCVIVSLYLYALYVLTIFLDSTKQLRFYPVLSSLMGFTWRKKLDK